MYQINIDNQKLTKLHFSYNNSNKARYFSFGLLFSWLQKSSSDKIKKFEISLETKLLPTYSFCFIASQKLKLNYKHLIQL